MLVRMRPCRFFTDIERVFSMVFFFQAEDGIRDWSVTGVQTCALPICPNSSRWEEPRVPGRGRPRANSVSSRTGRSEERRVGKECRSRWTTYNKTNKNIV